MVSVPVLSKPRLLSRQDAKQTTTGQPGRGRHLQQVDESGPAATDRGDSVARERKQRMFAKCLGSLERFVVRRSLECRRLRVSK